MFLESQCLFVIKNSLSARGRRARVSLRILRSLFLFSRKSQRFTKSCYLGRRLAINKRWSWGPHKELEAPAVTQIPHILGSDGFYPSHLALRSWIGRSHLTQRGRFAMKLILNPADYVCEAKGSILVRTLIDSMKIKSLGSNQVREK